MNNLTNIEDLKCICCQNSLYKEGRLNGNYVELSKNKYGKEEINDIYLTCKDGCFGKIDQSYFKMGFNPGVCFELSDLTIPELYLQHINYLVDRLHNKKCIYTEDTLKKEKRILSILAQSVFRNDTEEEQKRLKVLRSVGLF